MNMSRASPIIQTTDDIKRSRGLIGQAAPKRTSGPTRPVRNFLAEDSCETHRGLKTMQPGTVPSVKNDTGLSDASNCTYVINDTRLSDAHQRPTDANQQTETHITSNAEIKIEIEIEDKPTHVVNNGTPLKQEPVQRDSVDTWPNDYDSHFKVVKQEKCEKSSEIEHCSDNHADTRAITDDITSSKEELASISAWKHYDNSISGSIQHSTRGDSNLFNCNICQNTFEENRLVEHMRTHAGGKGLLCSICQFTAAYKSQLEIHMRTHTGEKPFTCNMCRFKFTRRSDLKRHTKTHTGDKPYSCSVCQYKCVGSSDLKIHIMTHTGEKPFSCKHCPYKCVRKTELNIHMRNHTGEKPYACNVCDFRCTVNNTLKRHIMRNHKPSMSDPT